MPIRNLVFTYIPGGPRKYQSCVTHILLYCSPFLFIDNCSDTPGYNTPVSLVFHMESIFSVSAHVCCPILHIDFSSVASLSDKFANFCFPLRSMASKSDFLVASSIGDR